MYIPDPIGRPLCNRCLTRFVDGGRPPWQPDRRSRLTRDLARLFGLPANVLDDIVECLVEDWEV